jgi:hypothetical protein
MKNRLVTIAAFMLAVILTASGCGEDNAISYLTLNDTQRAELLLGSWKVDKRGYVKDGDIVWIDGNRYTCLSFSDMIFTIATGSSDSSQGTYELHSDTLLQIYTYSYTDTIINQLFTNRCRFVDSNTMWLSYISGFIELRLPVITEILLSRVKEVSNE